MKRLLISGFIAMSLISCFDLRETVRIESPQKVRVRFDIQLDSLLLEVVEPESLIKQLKREDSLANFDIRGDSGGVSIIAEYPYVSINRITTIDSTLRVEERGNRIVLTKRIESTSEDTMGISALFRGRLYVFRLSTRKPILKSNANMRINDTLHVWIIPLDSLIRGGINRVIRAEIER